MVGRPSVADFERMIRGNTFKKIMISVTNIKTLTQSLSLTSATSAVKQYEKNRNSDVGLCRNPRKDKIKNEDN